MKFEIVLCEDRHTFTSLNTELSQLFLFWEHYFCFETKSLCPSCSFGCFFFWIVVYISLKKTYYFTTKCVMLH